MTVAENIIIARHCRRKTGIWDSLIGSPRLKKGRGGNQEYIKKCLEYVGIYDKKDWLAKKPSIRHAAPTGDRQSSGNRAKPDPT